MMYGIEEFDDKELELQAAKMAEATVTYAKSIANPFNTNEGMECLNALRAETTNKSCFDMNRIHVPATQLTPEMWMAVREGQNSVVRFIENCILTAQQGILNKTGSK